MAMNFDTISVTTTATEIVASNDRRKNLVLHNVGANPIYIGSDNSVTTALGYPIYNGEKFYCNDYTGVIYGIVAASTEDIQFIEEER